ncbi:MAG: MBL fold metallo-hydrolase [Burkholderiales bacterium]|nr:MBL fold metallo-hydrolase [Anaerolineae bacterium]
MRQLSENLFLFEDICNVYVIRNGKSAILIDFGTGDVLSQLSEIDIERVTDVLMTHHHRDQAQGLQRAVDAGINVWVPHTEQDLFHSVDAHWQAREIYNNYNQRQDRFSLLEPVQITGTLLDYETRDFGGVTLTVIATPGHTTGSITLLAEVDSQRLAFTGDLISAPGKVWMMSATQWTYNGAEGVMASIPSLLDLQERHPNTLLPSHGEPITDPTTAIDLLVGRLWELLQLRGNYPGLMELYEHPYEAITPHLLMHRKSMSNCYVLLSKSGKAMFIDFGYDFNTELPYGTDRASRRPWLATLPALKAQFGVSSIDVVMPTHYHDDHVAGINLLSRVEGAQVWAADMFADILENPTRYDLPCIWYDPIHVDRKLPLETPIHWEEYTFTLYHLPGHTYYAVAIAFEVDGKRVIAGGDQYQDDGEEMNYVYPNRFRPGDYGLSADLYKELQPDLIITGHWQPRWVVPAYYKRIDKIGADIERLHRELQPETLDLRGEGFVARLEPYQPTVHAGESIEFQAEIVNPYKEAADAELKVIVPQGWQTANESLSLTLPAHGIGTATFSVTPPPDFTGRRARVTVDVTINGHRFGQQGEALVNAV